MSEMITITKETYDELCDDSLFLTALRACGVDNWQGYGDACEMYEQMENESEDDE